jgi:CBS domain-containing protein
MNVGQLMKSTVATCGCDDTLVAAARLMWDGDFGCVPVTDDEQRLVGMITDRDICMAGYLEGRPLGAIKVGDVMAKEVHSCRREDSLAAAESLMRTERIRRLPVVDSDQHVVGILSLNDIACEWDRERRSGARETSADEVAETLASVCSPREHAIAAAA